MLNKSENNGTEENGLVTPTPRSSLALFASIPNFGRAVIWMFNSLSIDKEEIIMLFPR